MNKQHRLYNKDTDAMTAFCMLCQDTVTMHYNKPNDAYYCINRVRASAEKEKVQARARYHAKEDTGKKKHHKISEFRRHKGKGYCLSCRKEVQVILKDEKLLCINYFKTEQDRKQASRKRDQNQINTINARRKGVNVDDYDTTYKDLFTKQDGGCAICGAKEVALVMDHNHTTGAVRGLLCRQHNVGLGMFQDNPDTLAKAIEYLTSLLPEQE